MLSKYREFITHLNEARQLVFEELKGCMPQERAKMVLLSSSFCLQVLTHQPNPLVICYVLSAVVYTAEDNKKLTFHYCIVIS